MPLGIGTSQATQPFVIPTLSAASTQYADLKQKRAELKERRSAAATELQQRWPQEQTDRPRIGVERTDHKIRAAKMAGLPAPDPTPPDRIDELQALLRDLDLAIEMVDHEISGERTRASVLVCQQVAGRHNQLVKTMCATLATFYEAAQAYYAFADELNRNGVYWSQLRPAQPIELCGGDSAEPIGRYFREMVRDGFISKSDVPPALRWK